TAHAEKQAAQGDVLVSRSLRIKAVPNIEQRRDAAFTVDVATHRFVDAGEDTQQRALAGAVGADQGHAIAMFEGERDTLERPYTNPVPGVFADLAAQTDAANEPVFQR